MKHQGTWGDGAYILKTGQMLEPQVQSSNEIRIRDGALMVQGALGCVKVNTYDPVTIQNGTQGMKRIDLICWQYTYDAEQDVESAEWVVIQGTPAETDPQQPAYTDGDIQQGDSPVQVPVFAVELDGINVTGVTTLLQTAPTLEELNSKFLVASVSKVFTTNTYYKQDYINCAKSGYKALGIVGHKQDSGANYTFANLFLTGDTATVMLTETNKVPWHDGKLTVTLYILYEKL